MGFQKMQFSKNQWRINTARYGEVDNGMYKWLKKARHSNTSVSSGVLKQKSRRVSQVF